MTVRYLRAGKAQLAYDELCALETDECVVWPFATNRGGYGDIWDPASRRRVPVHRLVCEHRHGPAPGPGYDAAHDAGGTPCTSKACMNYRHLRWATRADNNRDKVRHGTTSHLVGIANPIAKLDDDAVRAIRAHPGSEVTTARAFNISPSLVGAIRRRERWQHVGDQHDAV